MTSRPIVSLLLLINTWLIVSVSGQSETDLNGFYRWEHFTVASGLPSSEINCITQDSTGFIWFGTPEGLVRFDGYQMVVYAFDKADSSTLSCSDITSIVVEGSGDLWVGTTLGLNRFDPTTGKSVRYYKNETESSGLPDNYVRALLIDSESRLWVETVDGSLSLFNRATGQVVSFKHEAPSQVYYRYHQIFEDGDGKLWIASRNLPPLRFDPDSGLFVSLQTSRTNSRFKRERDGACYIQDARHHLLMGALDGLYQIDRIDGTVKKIHPNSTFCLVSDGDGGIWAATGGGVVRHYSDSRPSESLTHDDNNHSSLINNQVNVVFVDASGCLWAGTREGISKWSPMQHKFRLFTHQIGNDNSPISSRMNVLVEGPDLALWIGTDGAGVDRFDLLTETFRHYTPKGTPGMKGGRIKALYFDKYRTLWVGLWNGTGFGSLDIDAGRFDFYSFDATTQLYDWYNAFVEDELGNFYVGFWGANGVTLFNRKTKRFEKSFCYRPGNQVVSRLTSDLFRDRLGKIWIGTSDNGFSIYNPWSDRMTSFPASHEGFPEEGVHAFFEDSQGRMWIAAKGLYRFYQSTKQFVNVAAWYQLPAKAFYAITEDLDQMLWLNTDRGLIRFNPVDYSYTMFTSYDGLQGNQFTKAACRLADGRIAVGGSGGFNLFDPSTIAADDFVPPLAVTALTINGKPIQGEDLIKRLLNLQYNENFITISFAAFDFNSSENIRYSYQLSGFDDRTVETANSNHEAVFTNIPPGHYRFVVHSTNSSGKWVNNHLEINIRIASPWWYTWWVKSLVVFLIGGALFWLVKNRNEKIRIREESLELQQKLLRSRMNPHFIFNSLFAIQNFIYSNSPDTAGRYLSDFALLMRRILDQSAEDFIPLEQEIKTLHLYLKLQMMRFPDKFSASIDVDPQFDINEVFVPPMFVQPLLENAIEHGIKNRSGGVIRIDFRQVDCVIVVSVSDNGVGMPLPKTDVSSMGSSRKHALQITHDRIALLNAKFDTQLSMSTRATNPADNHFPGTTIEIFIPAHPKTFKPCYT